jgi:hypothetical protein
MSLVINATLSQWGDVHNENTWPDHRLDLQAWQDGILSM